MSTAVTLPRASTWMRALTWPLRKPSAIASFGKSGGSREIAFRLAGAAGRAANVGGAAAANCAGVSRSPGGVVAGGGGLTATGEGAAIDAAAGGAAFAAPGDGAAADAGVAGGGALMTTGGGVVADTVAGSGFAVATTDSDPEIVLGCSIMIGAAGTFCGAAADVIIGRAATRASGGGRLSRGTRATGKDCAVAIVTLAETAGSAASGKAAAFGSGVVADGAGVATFVAGIVVVDSPECVPYQMPTASASADAPAAKGAIGNFRVRGPMTTGAIEDATWALGEATLAGGAPPPALAAR